MKPIRTVLVDDHALIRAGICELLEQQPGIEVIGEADNGREAVRIVNTQRPDLVLMDIGMKGLNGLEATRQITKDCPQTRVLILSMFGTEQHATHALQAGAVGYLLKDSARAELELAVQAVTRGETYLSPTIATCVIRQLMRSETEDVLTIRQREILQLVAEGSTTKQIAQILHLGVRTVETHRVQLMSRLNIHNIAGLVRYAVRTGLVTVEG